MISANLGSLVCVPFLYISSREKYPHSDLGDAHKKNEAVVDNATHVSMRRMVHVKGLERCLTRLALLRLGNIEIDLHVGPPLHFLSRSTSNGGRELNLHQQMGEGQVGLCRRSNGFVVLLDPLQPHLVHRSKIPLNILQPYRCRQQL